MFRFAALGRFLVAQSSGVAALRRGLPLYFAIGIFATVIFAPQGLDASTVVRIAERNPVVRLLLLAAWVIATLPTMRAIVTLEQNGFLRALPVAKSILVWLGALMIVAETPWLALWLRGGGLTGGLGAMLVAMALHACLVVPRWTVIDVALGAATCAAWLLPSSWARSFTGACVFPIALLRAWQRAPEAAVPTIRAPIVGPPVRALATAYTFVLARRHKAALARTLIVVGVSLAWTALAVRNEEAWHGSFTAIRVVLAVWVPGCVFAAATVTAPVLRAERAAAWVLAAHGVDDRTRRGASLVLLAAAGAAVGLAAALVLVAILDLASAARFALASVLSLSGAALSALTEIVARWSMRDEGHDGGRLVLALLALIAAAEGVLWLAHS